MAQHSNRPDRRRAAHSKATEPGAGHNTGPDWPYPGTDHPSWPASDAGGWQQAAADPSWPYPGTDQPSWPAGADGDWPQPGTDYPSWPAGGPGADWVPAHGEGGWQQQQAPVVQHHDERWQAPAPVPPRAPVPVTRWEYPARPTGAHTKTGQWSAKLARTQDTAPQTYYELAFGDGRLQVMLTEPPAAGQRWASGMHARQVEVLERDSGAAGWEAEDLRSTDSVQVAERILADADYQAAEIRREAGDEATAIREAAEQEAAEIRQQAADRAAPVREAADREAAELKQQAADQATAMREAAEREAAAMRTAAQQDADVLRSAIESMTAELSRVASVLDGTLTAPPTAPPNGAPRADIWAASATAPAAPSQEAEPAATAATDYASPGGYAAPSPLPQREAGRPTARPGRRPPDEPSAAPDDFARPEDTPGPGGAVAGRQGASTASPSALRKPPGKSGAQTRQQVAAKRFAIGAAGLVTFGLLLGAFNLFAYHSFNFFVFRGQGVGATPPSPLPAQPNGIPSPATHHRAAGSEHKQLEAKGRHHRRVHDQSAHGGSHG